MTLWCNSAAESSAFFRDVSARKESTKLEANRPTFSHIGMGVVEGVVLLLLSRTVA